MAVHCRSLTESLFDQENSFNEHNTKIYLAWIVDKFMGWKTMESLDAWELKKPFELFAIWRMFKLRGTTFYVLIDWVGGPDGKIFGPRSWRTDRAQRGPCVMTEGQIFSRPARPNSVNKHFIIWPPRFSFFFFFYLFIYFREIKFAIGIFTYVARFGRTVGT